jgi:hypothetical protein
MNKKEQYKNELKLIGDLYGIGRQSRMIDLIEANQGVGVETHKSLHPHSMTQFIRFSELFGKVSDDLAIFLTDDGYLTVGWSNWLNDPSRQRRGGLTRRANLEFTPTTVHFWHTGLDEGRVACSVDSDYLKQLIELYRTHRPE